MAARRRHVSRRDGGGPCRARAADAREDGQRLLFTDSLMAALHTNGAPASPPAEQAASRRPPGAYRTVLCDMRITLVISTLHGGGAERVTANMANYWAAKGWGVTILTTDFGSQSSCYRLHPCVAHLDLGSPRFHDLPIDSQTSAPITGLIDDCSQSERAVLIPRTSVLLKLRRAISSTEPDVVISYMNRTNICVLSATRGLGLPVIVTEHCDQNENSMGVEWELLRRRLYPQARYVTVLTEESLDHLSSVAGMRGRVIPNAVTPPVFSSSDEMPRKNGRLLLAMGRLAHEKGFDLLLRAFARIAEKHPDWTLEILGEGPVRPYLESSVQRHGLAERVRLPGFTRRPFDAMRRADLFVLSSLDEGFPNVLLEAMACGVAVVSFDCPSGPRHIIRHGVDGILVPPRDARALAAALDRLMGDEAERRRLAAKAPEVAERFGVEKVMSMWEELVFDCVKIDHSRAAPGPAARI
jgi:GalNAc-alpha-(1->4)-GalNAc-alpha-(1->3)-diNAcBac-PP-undecaprenol alpha-1,4-N-acetyl-D-galactosaminyltransferase